MCLLNDENLCDMYTALASEKSLCRTCKDVQACGRIRRCQEMTLSVSCPEVARFCLVKEPVRFLTYEQQGRRI